jgi:large subunit ribosomal protein L21
MAFAVIKTGGKQYKVAANDILRVEKLDAEPGTIVTFDQVLMVGDDAGTTIGLPLVEGATVAAEFIGTKKQKTVIVFKKNRRHNYRRRNGHRQQLSTVRITEILTNGATPDLSLLRGTESDLNADSSAEEITALDTPIDAAVEASNAEAVADAPKARSRKAATPADADTAEASKPNDAAETDSE